MRRPLLTALAITALVAAGAVTSVPASAAQNCQITWGSQPKYGDLAGPDARVTGVRAGRHECFDRLVIDIQGTYYWYYVDYTSEIIDMETDDEVLPVAGGATLDIMLAFPASTYAYEFEAGNIHYPQIYAPANPSRVVNVSGWSTFRQVVWAGTYAGSTRIGLGVRARLPFRVMLLDDPGDRARLVVDVAHRW